jgi:hypothetical protein
MKWTKEIIIFSLIAVLFGLFGYKALMQPEPVQAQVAPTTLTIHAISDHTKCSLAQTPQLDGRGPGICVANDGIWVQTSVDTTPWQISKPSTNVAFTVNRIAPDASGNIALTMSNIPGTISSAQDKSSRTCPVTAFIVGITDTIKLGSCGD